MLRGGPQASAQDKQQKQKKRLSFRDPEVEGPLRNYLYSTGGKSKTLARPTKATNSRKASASLEDLTLEDQALKIAQHVGSAFSDLSLTDNEQAGFPSLDSISKAFEAQRETEIRDSSPPEFGACLGNRQQRSFGISAEDEDFLDALVPPLADSTMRGPSLQSGDHNSTKNCIPTTEPSLSEGWPVSSGTQHQIQLLRYQLEQQNQQTQMAMHQVQLLQDQVGAESAARRKAQEQNNLLMQQNKELLNHMEKLFQQIEDLEKQIQDLEREKRSRKVAASPESQIEDMKKQIQDLEREKRSRKAAASSESQVSPIKQPTPTYAFGSRTESANEKPMQQNRSLAVRRSSLTSMKPLACTTSKISAAQNSIPAAAGRKIPSISSRPSSVQAKTKDTGTKEKETLRIGDASPPVQSGTANQFGSPWRLKSTDNSAQSTVDKSGSAARSRAGSFSSYVKKPQEGGMTRNTLFDSNNSSFSSTSMSGKKHSSSTSDLHNPPGTFQGKSSLMIEEPSSGVKSAVSNLSISSISKLPRYQPYTGWQRRTSLASEEEQVSAISKDSYKSSPQTSLFNR